MWIIYLVLKSTHFFRCILYIVESLHIFGAVLTRFQVRLNNTLSDVLCKTKQVYTHTQSVLFICGSTDFALWKDSIELSRVTV